MLAGLVVLFALGVAGSLATAWETVLLWQNRVPFSTTASVTDPIFGRDISFFLFELPFLRLVQALFNGLVVTALLLASARYLVGAMRGAPVFATQVRMHLAILGGLFLLSVAFGYQLDKLELVYSTRGSVETSAIDTIGVSFTDQNAQFLAFDVLTVLSGLAAAFLVGAAFTRMLWPLGLTLGVWFLASILIGRAYPEAVQYFTVRPNQFAQEEPYISNNIAMTRLAFGLDAWEDDRPFGGEAVLTEEAIVNDEDTFRNARLWDYRPLGDAFDQLQAIRPYYDFTDVDTDRYTIDGAQRQVMLSARELDPSALGGGWVNERINFTHGVGMAMTPVNEVTTEGQPRLIVRNLPPVSSEGAPEIAQPRIYFGERPSGYIVVGAQDDEFDYPTGSSDAVGHLDALDRRQRHQPRHDADAGAVRAALPRPQPAHQRPGHEREPAAVRPGDRAAAAEDRPVPALRQGPVHRHRRGDRRPRLRPGRIHRVRPLPARELVRPARARVHEPRWRGVQLHPQQRQDHDRRVRRHDDVLRRRPERSDRADVCEGLPDALPADRRAAREPCRRTSASRRSSSTSRPGCSGGTTSRRPQQFFRSDDVWTVPEGQTTEQTLPSEAYYVVMRMPGEPEAEFLLLQPMVPRNRTNMIAWVAARSDPGVYGTTRVYRFPSDTTVFGPAQIEARIDADGAISEQITLWSQAGSTVIRGNLIVIPVGDSVVYLQPFYLQSTGTALPEFQRIVVASPREVVWSRTLGDGLRLLLAAEEGGGETPPPGPGESPGPSPEPTTPETEPPSGSPGPARRRRPATSRR